MKHPTLQQHSDALFALSIAARELEETEEVGGSMRCVFGALAREMELRGYHIDRIRRNQQRNEKRYSQ
jgi:hypothetical protein